nr:Protein of unknown function DB domain containing protein [Haemonchus contortus]
MYLPLLAAVITNVYGQFPYYQQQTAQQYYPPQAAAVPQQPFEGWQRWEQPQLPPQLQFFQQQQQQQLPQEQLQQQLPQQQQFQQQPQQLNFAQPSLNQFNARPVVERSPQQEVVLQQQQQFQRFEQFPQFQQPEVPQQFPVANTINNQFQPNIVRQVPQVAPQPFVRGAPPPTPLINVNREKFRHSETPRIFDKQFRVQTLTQNELLVQQAQQGDPRLPAKQRSLVEAYGPEEKLIDGLHPSYIEDIAKTTPADQFRRVIQPPRTVQNKNLKSNDVSGSVVRRPHTRPRPAPVNTRVVATTRSPPPVPQPRPVPAKQQRPPLNIVVPNRPVPKVAALSTAKNANDIFLSCCKSIKVAKPCERICNFDVLNKKTLTGMFLGTDPCPQSHGLDLMQCAAQSDDHTQCCIERGVHTTSAGNKCLGFCNMRPGNTFQADVSMLPCWSVLNDIKSCFRDHIQNN